MPVSVEEEQARVVPLIAALTRRFPQALISIDTTKAEVARSALDAGAAIVNDISAGRMESRRESGHKRQASVAEACRP